MDNPFKSRRKTDRKDTPQELIELVEIRGDDEDLAIPECPDDASVTSDAAFSAETPDKNTPNSHPNRSQPEASFASPNATQEASIFTFMGASGGVGTTSLATQIAYELAMSVKPKQLVSRHPQDPQVCLIDLDFESGACAHHLDVLPSLNLHEISNASARIDTAFTSALVSTHPSGISLLATPNMPGNMSKADPMAIMAILDAASQLYQYVIVDMPRHYQSWTQAVIGGSDFFGIVAEPTIASLHLARNQIKYSQEHLGEDVNVHPILSKYERRTFRNALRLSDAESALGQEMWGTICVDADTVSDAINCGEPVGAIRKDSRYAKDSRKLVEKLIELRQNHHETPQEIIAA